MIHMDARNIRIEYRSQVWVFVYHHVWWKGTYRPDLTRLQLTSCKDCDCEHSEEGCAQRNPKPMLDKRDVSEKM